MGIPLTVVSVAAAVSLLLFPVVFLIDGWTRPGYRSVRHPVSALALGSRGWIQTGNFLLCGTAVTAGAVALAPAVDSLLLAVVVGAFGLSLIASGVFPMDAMRAYPPGTPDETPAEVSWRHTAHDWAGMFVFGLAPLAAIVVTFVLPDTGWRIYSAATGAVGVIGFVAFGQAWEHNHPRTGLLQKATIIVGWVWLALLFLHASQQ